MLHRIVSVVGFALAAFLALPIAAAASPITSFTAGALTNTFTPGQSVTTPAGGPWDDLTFNWFTLAGAPNALGTLFLLTQVYAGTPAALGAATPGFLASTSNISGGMWLFNPSVTIQGATQYFFYSTTALQVAGSASDLYPGGNYYQSFSGFAYVSQSGDLNFALAGSLTTAAVPEPASLVLLGTGLAAAVVMRRRRRRGYDGSRPTNVCSTTSWDRDICPARSGPRP